ncbi:unnamed protein product [Paramecium octaurelia]|uniref:Uncharacterized protein n=1 Tax=Paramecium octaurelia TaxID=43137 RepID=A0A8S1S3L9_PAROT|nr:unnamed protein product [Paramecium octaurelia]
MNSLLYQKRECFSLRIRRNEIEKIFKEKRIPQLSKEMMLDLINNKDQESINRLTDATAGSKEQTLDLIQIGGIQFFYELLQSKEKTNAFIGLGNLCSEKSVQDEVLELKIIEYMIEEVHRYKNLEDLSLRLWFLSVLAKFKRDSQNGETEIIQREQLFNIFWMYQKKYPDVLKIQQECFHGFYTLTKVTFIQNELMELCCNNLNKGIDNIILKIMYYLINDYVKFVQILHKSQFIEFCAKYLQITCRQKYTLRILYYYAQYYVETIIQNKEIVNQIIIIQNSQKHQKQIILLHYAMLFKCQSSQFMEIIKEFEIINNLKVLLENFQYEQQTLCLLALLKQTNKDIIKELIPDLERVYQNKKDNEKTLKKLQLILD